LPFCCGAANLTGAREGEQGASLCGLIVEVFTDTFEDKGRVSSDGIVDVVIAADQ
tara:strand:- start:155 stop:319 length:165 start_codon:yes stop_codon:yes gene_type:complete